MTDEPMGHVRIGLKEIYEQLVAVQKQISDMRGDMQSASIADRHAEYKLKDHEARLRLLEKRVWAIPGAATIIAVAAIAVPHLT